VSTEKKTNQQNKLIDNAEITTVVSNAGKNNTPIHFSLIQLRYTNSTKRMNWHSVDFNFVGGLA